MSSYADPIVCAQEGCEQSHANHKWASIEASAAGWFMSKSGQEFCPDHVPAWLAKWRIKNTEYHD